MKIKRIINFPINFIVFLLILILIYTRFINLGWGLPYPMHPDERNMALALQNLICKIPQPLTKNSVDIFIHQCFNPNFYAYGQFPLYLGYLIIFLKKIIFKEINLLNFGNFSISFNEAILALRFISATISVITAFVILKIYFALSSKKISNRFFLPFLIIIFSPYAIQFAHFGTTESLLIFFYSMILYLCLLYFLKKIEKKLFIPLTSITSGLAVATKISSILFLALPTATILIYSTYHQDKKIITKKIFIDLFLYYILMFAFLIIFSPHNFINYQQLLLSMNYESAVALGKIDVFYTRQFFLIRKLIFPLIKIFPYALGVSTTIIFFLSFFFIAIKDIKINLIRLAYLFYFIPNLIIYTQWTRFYAPIFPIMLLFSLFLLDKVKNNILYYLIAFTMIIPGVAFLNIYHHQDIRIEASQWIFKNAPDQSFFLSETANVVDVPFLTDQTYNKNFFYVSFNFYDLDTNKDLANDLRQTLNKADYIIVPSRRILFNLTCIANPNDFAYQKKRCRVLNEKYPKVAEYYKDVVLNKNKYRLIKTFYRYPRIGLFDKTILKIPDEHAEETFSVFDHPVIRVYQKINTN
jgi:hypothetical protein